MFSVQSSLHHCLIFEFDPLLYWVSVHWFSSLFHGSFTNLTKGTCLHVIKLVNILIIDSQ